MASFSPQGGLKATPNYGLKLSANMPRISPRAAPGSDMLKYFGSPENPPFNPIRNPTELAMRRRLARTGSK